MNRSNDGVVSNAGRKAVIADWLIGWEAKLGCAFDVPRLPDGYYESRNPIQEAIEMVGPDKVIVAAVDKGE